MKAAVLAALLVSPAVAADSPPLALLSESFGAPGVETLAARGLIVLQGKPGARRLAAVHWKALSALDGAKSSCLALASAADALGHEAAPAGPDLGLSACRSLPDGLMTPSLHALAEALEAGHEERWALHLASAPPSGVPGKPNFFDTSWGRDLIERRHADALENPAVLAKPVFDDLLAGPRPEKEAAALFAAEASARGASAPEALIAADVASGTLSEELRAQLRRTLSNERRRWSVAKARAAAADLLGQASVKRELEDLRGAAKALASRPNLPAALEAASSRAASSVGVVRLLSAGLHLQESTRLSQHELGDEAIVSGAYWVDGLRENDSIDVEETLVVETERGFPSAQTNVYKRRNGGPYPYSRTVKISETRSFAARSLVSSAGSALIAERVEVILAPDFELALGKEAEAAGLRSACRPKDAEAAYLALETLVAEPAKVKPQYKDLADRARKAKEASKSDAEALMKLEEALAAARADSAPQQCRYETNRVDEALKIALRLPAGCDRDLPELHALRATITRRAADQNWFLKASSDARSRRKSCDLDAARARWSEALAALDADPGARCGRVAEEEGRAKTEFAELARKLAWREELGKSLAKAEAETAPARRLELLRGVTSRLGALNADCLGAESKRAAALSEAASKALTAPPDVELARRMPSDGALASAVAEVRSERARRLEAAGASEKAAVEPAAVEGPKAAAPPVKISPKKPAKRKKTEAAPK
jgi:hypothetical protein